jgi:hypothetical protein
MAGIGMAAIGISGIVNRPVIPRIYPTLTAKGDET